MLLESIHFKPIRIANTVRAVQRTFPACFPPASLRDIKIVIGLFFSIRNLACATEMHYYFHETHRKTLEEEQVDLSQLLFQVGPAYLDVLNLFLFFSK